MNTINEGPNTYEHWLDLGRIIIPCLKGRPIVKNWQDPGFKISKEERQKLLAYLQNRPYAEVFQLIALIVGLKPIENSKSKEEQKN
mgnify:CR=1 FL=1